MTYWNSFQFDHLPILAPVWRIFRSISVRNHWSDRQRQTNYWKSPRLGLVGASSCLFRFGCFAVLQSTCGTGKRGFCHNFFCNLVWICRCHHQRAAIGWNYFFFPIRMRTWILRVPYGPSGYCRRSFQNATAGSIFNSSGIGSLIYCISMVDKSVRYFYWTIYCSFKTNLGGLSSSFLLYLFGMDDFLVLSSIE